MRRDLQVLLRYAALLVAVIALYAVLFQVIMLQVEGQSHSWIPAVYWTLITMTTLGFGDVVFTGDVGRLFTIVVLGSGVVLLLVVLPLALASIILAVRFSLAPLHRFRTRLEARGVRDLSEVPAADLPTEIRPLAATLNSLLARLRDAFEAERSFAANAAHELGSGCIDFRCNA